MPPRAAAAARQRARLPKHVDRALIALPAAAERLAGLKGPELNVRELEVLEDATSQVRSYVLECSQDELAALLMGHETKRAIVALAQLCAVGVRTDISGSEARVPFLLGMVECAIGATSKILSRYRASAPEASETAAALASVLLRSQSLHAAAVQAATACALLATDGGLGGAEKARLRVRAGSIGSNALVIVEALGCFCEARKDKALAASLLQALRESSLLDHVGRLLLLLPPAAGAAPPGRYLTNAQSVAVWYMCQVHNRLSRNRLSELIQPTGVVSGAITRELFGGSAGHALLTFGAAALSAADGGPCGLPRSPLLEAARPNNPGEAYPCVEALLVNRLIALLEYDQDRPQPSVPPRAAIRLMLRALRLTAASLGAAGGHVAQAPGGTLRVELSWAGGRRAEAQEYNLLCMPDDAAVISRQPLHTLLRVAECWPEAWAAEAEAAFVPLLSALRHYLASSESWPLVVPYVPRVVSLLARAAQHLLRSAPGGCQLVLSPAPHGASVAAALEGGAVPLLECLLRAAGDDPHGPEAQLAAAVLRTLGHNKSIAALLLHSPPRQAAAFVATLAKLLRRMPPDAFLEPPPTHDYHSGHPEPPYTLLNLSLQLVEGVASAPQCSPPLSEPTDPASAPHAPSFVLAVAALELLPELCRLARGSLQELLRCADGRWTAGVALATSRLLEFLQQALAGARRTAAEDAPPCPSRRLAAACCVPFVVGEGGAVPFIGAVLEVVERDGSWLGSEALEVLAGCLDLIRYCPERICPSASPSGTGPSDASSAGAPPGPRAAAWKPWAVRHLASIVAETAPDQGPALVALAEGLERWERGEEQAKAPDPALTDLLEQQAQALAALRAEVRGVLPVCGNPACVSLAGDSEAGLRLQACGRCRLVSYCCRDCQTAHWKAGHKAACVAKEG